MKETPAYSHKVDALLAHAANFTADDFRQLAFAALDQAGVSAHTQRRVTVLVEED